jgi:diguanylate cyclase (GGDEF)-like protein/PAS domain S-box-containing protein
MVRPARVFGLVALLVVAPYLFGWFDFIERHLQDLRAGWYARPASGELVIVAIDPPSLRALEQWPWPRRYHAQAILRLLAAGVRRIGYDVEFSSSSNPVDDRALAEALAQAGADRIALPALRQWWRRPDGRLEVYDSVPLPLFSRHSSFAWIDAEPDPDGLVRQLPGVLERSTGPRASMPVWLLDDPTVTRPEVVLDFGIDPRTLPRVSFVDLLRGAYDPAQLAGKRVLVGPTASELGDWKSVPWFRALPGPVIQALAFESLLQDRALTRVDGWPVALGAGFLVLLLGPVFGRLSWRAGLLLCGSAILLLLVVASGLQLSRAIAVDSSAPLLGVFLAFAVAIMMRVERQARELVGQIGSLPGKDGLMRQLVDNTFDAIITFEPGGRVLSCNRAAERIFGTPAAAMIDNPIATLLPDGQGRLLASLAQEGGSRELVGLHESGRRFPVEATLSRMQVDEGWVGIAIVRDITDRKSQQAELERMALHDALTALPNRTLLSDRIAHAINAARRSRGMLAILLLDLDRFKDVNDTLGHQVGDLLLTQIGPRLRQPLRNSDTVARLGGDEFAILLPGPTDLETACRAAERIVESLSAPFCIQDLVLEVGVSIGVALYPEHGESAQELLQHADVAMYAAKRNHLGFVVYSAASDTNSVRQLTLTGELRRAIEEDQLVLEFQPKIEAMTGELAGVEALIRWQHPEHGAIPPDEFIHSAEQTGLIKPLTSWVLNSALRQLRDWSAQGYEFGVAVNLSVKSLQDPQLPEMVLLLLRSWDQRPQRLTLEITESALMADPATAFAVVQRIAQIGCKLSLDDFGTGYSSLAYLQKLPIDELKIDRSFVLAMTRDDNAAVIVRSVVQLGKGLGLSVVAEGVESREAFERLRSLGCDQVQGFLFGPAMSGDELLAWLREHGPSSRREDSRLSAVGS